MPADPIIGIDTVLLRNTGTFASPVWVEIDGIKDLTVPLSHEEADTTSRDSGGYVETVPTLKTLEYAWNMNYDSSEASFIVLQQAWENRTNIELFSADTDPLATGSEGPRAICRVITWDITYPLRGACEVAVVMKPVTNSDGPPSWYTEPA